MKDHLGEIGKLDLQKARLVKQHTTTSASLMYPDVSFDPLGLSSLPIVTRTYDLPKHLLVDMDIHTRLAGANLLDLLTATRKVFDPTKPVRSQSNDVYENIEDINEMRPSKGLDQPLWDGHLRTLGSLWLEFFDGEHNRYEQALHGLSQEQVIQDFDDHIDKLRLKEDVIANLPASHGRRGHKEVEFIMNNLRGDPELQPAYIVWRDQNVPDLKDVMYWPTDAKQKFLNEFLYPLGQSPQKAKRLVENSAFHCDLDILDEAQVGTGVPLDWVGDGAPHQGTYLGDRRVKITLENSFMLVNVQPERNIELYRSIDISAPRDLHPRLMAARSKESGEWTYVSSGIPDILKVDWSENTSLSLGLMFALYNSPDARAKMPERAHFKPKPPEEVTDEDPKYDDQEMAEIQNVLMASALRSMIMKGKFFDKGLNPYLDFLK